MFLLPLILLMPINHTVISSKSSQPEGTPLTSYYTGTSSVPIDEIIYTNTGKIVTLTYTAGTIRYSIRDTAGNTTYTSPARPAGANTYFMGELDNGNIVLSWTESGTNQYIELYDPDMNLIDSYSTTSVQNQKYINVFYINNEYYFVGTNDLLVLDSNFDYARTVSLQGTDTLYSAEYSFLNEDGNIVIYADRNDNSGYAYWHEVTTSGVQVNKVNSTLPVSAYTEVDIEYATGGNYIMLCYSFTTGFYYTHIVNGDTYSTSSAKQITNTLNYSDVGSSDISTLTQSEHYLVSVKENIVVTDKYGNYVSTVSQPVTTGETILDFSEDQNGDYWVSTDWGGYYLVSGGEVAVAGNDTVSITNVTTTDSSATITYSYTDNNGSGNVEYRYYESGTTPTSVWTSTPTTETGTGTYTMTINNLTPTTSYSLEMRVDGTTTNQYSFTTGAEGSVGNPDNGGTGSGSMSSGNLGLILGITLGAVAGVIVLGGVGYYVFNRKKK